MQKAGFMGRNGSTYTYRHIQKKVQKSVPPSEMVFYLNTYRTLIMGDHSVKPVSWSPEHFHHKDSLSYGISHQKSRASIRSNSLCAD